MEFLLCEYYVKTIQKGYWSNIDNEIHDLVKKKTDLVEHFQYYLTPISDEESVYDSKYNYDCVFLGQGFHRLSQVEFQKERDAFFSQSYPFNYKICSFRVR